MFRFVLTIDCATRAHDDALPVISKFLFDAANVIEDIGLHPTRYATLRDDSGKDIGSMYLLEKEITH